MSNELECWGSRDTNFTTERNCTVLYPANSCSSYCIQLYIALDLVHSSESSCTAHCTETKSAYTALRIWYIIVNQSCGILNLFLQYTEVHCISLLILHIIFLCVVHKGHINIYETRYFKSNFEAQIKFTNNTIISRTKNVALISFFRL